MDGQGQGRAGGQGGGVQGGVLEGGQDRPHLPSLGRLTGHVTDSQGARFLTHPGSMNLLSEIETRLYNCCPANFTLILALEQSLVLKLEIGQLRPF